MCKGKTQNPNEYLNSIVRSVIHKRVFVRLPTLKYDIYTTISNFNDGFISKVKMMEKLGLSPGKTLIKCMQIMRK